jgi:hypothetical protein
MSGARRQLGMPLSFTCPQLSALAPHDCFPGRRVLGYYSGSEDAFDMRTACSRDAERRSVVPLSRPVKPDELWDERVT